MKPTIKDVAKLAGVSFKTVSRVVNNEAVVGEKLQEKVWQAIRELNYSPNLSARGLRGAASSIGFIYDNPNSHYVITMQKGILDVCLKEGFELVIRPCDSRRDDTLTQLITMIDRSRVGGVVLAPPISENTDAVAAIKKRSVKMVRLISSAEIPADAENSPCICVNDRKAAYDITSHLIGLGHRHIAFLAGDEEHGSTAERREGYCEALRENGLPLDPGLILPGQYSFDSGVERATALLQEDSPTKNLTAIFACNDEIAAGALFAARLRGVNVPAQLSVAGFEDSPFSRQSWPRLTTAAQPSATIAQHAAQLLIQTIRAKGEGVNIHSEAFVPSLVVRESSAAPQV